MAVPSADAREARHEATTTAAASTTIFLILSEHVWQRPYGAGFGLSWTLIWSSQRTTGACIIPRTLTRSRGEFRHPTPAELRAVFWAILRKIEVRGSWRGKIGRPPGPFKTHRAQLCLPMVSHH